MKLIPGLLLSIIVMFIGIYGADLIGYLLIKLGLLSSNSKSPISSIFVAIILGIFIRNIFGVKQIFIEGISFSMKYILRVGIVLLGFRLSLLEALKLGALGIPLIIISIASGLFITLYLTNKLKQSNRLGTLIACGTGICGVTAIMATSPVIKAKEDEISYAVANITIFGLTGMILYPFLAQWLFAGDPIKIGMFLGTAIHDTAQVTGSALIYDQVFDMKQVVDVATVTKLTRNLFIIGIIPFVSYLYYKTLTEETTRNEQNRTTQLPKWYTFIPLFVIGFLFFAFLRTVGDMTLANFGSAFGLFQASIWELIYTTGSSFGTTYLLGMAMAGVGLSTDFRKFKGIGVKPFYIGFIAAVSVGMVSVVLISMFGSFITI